ncbi:MAG: D-alanine--D-alanine ligase [Clostridia bacterium]|nr:D-alanine--D-alanine ligase [Clostridia bacterium]
MTERNQNPNLSESAYESKEKLKIAVIFGGRSTEHAVSCVSASCIINHLDKTKYDIVTVGITYGGNWLPYSGPVELIPGDKWVEYALKENNFTPVPGRKRIDLALPLLSTCDCIFPALHGLNGEDGTVQGLFELIGKPYVGCGVYASACGMDKTFAKIQFEKAGIPQVEYIIAHKSVADNDPDYYIDAVKNGFGFPCFVKPASCGSSVGVARADDEKELLPALAKALRFDNKALIERYVDCKEIECGVLGNEDPIAFQPGEVRSTDKEFYDYDSKYVAGESIVIIPAAVPEQTLNEIKSLAIRAFKAVEGSGLARVDFFLQKDGKILLNEINTMPGFTDCSMYPKLAVSDGMPYSVLLDKLIAFALQKYVSDKRCYDER